MQGGTIRAACRRRRKDGTLVDVQIFVDPMVIEGKARGLMVLYEDITTRVEAEKAMAERHRLATLAARVGAALTGAMRCAGACRNARRSSPTASTSPLRGSGLSTRRRRSSNYRPVPECDSHIDGEHACIPVGKLEDRAHCRKRRGEISQITTLKIFCSQIAEWTNQEKMAAFAGYPLEGQWPYHRRGRGLCANALD